MIKIRPLSDLKSNLSEIESIVNGGEPVYLTQNGYGAMVILSLENYAALTDDVEKKLDEADRQAEPTTEHLSHEQVFGNIRRMINGE